jgi:hypothetical protein
MYYAEEEYYPSVVGLILSVFWGGGGGGVYIREDLSVFPQWCCSVKKSLCRMHGGDLNARATLWLAGGGLAT